jgi:hypothetical protein
MVAGPSLQSQVSNFNYTTITLLLKKDSLAPVKHSVEKINERGNLIERIRYHQPGETVGYIEQFTYDSIQRIILSTQTWFTRDQLPYTSSKRYIYDSTGFMAVSIYTSGPDTVIGYHQNDGSGKPKSSKTLSLATDFKYFRTGLTFYTYNQNDSCIRKENYDLTGKYLQTYDSIVYTDTSKTVWRFDYAKNPVSKNEYIFDQGQLVKNLDYGVYIMSPKKEFYLERTTSYVYKNGRLHTKMVQTGNTHWCEPDTGIKTEIYTYIYD